MIAGVCFAVIAPWVLGFLLASRLPVTANLNPALRLAHGYLIGTFLCTILLRLCNFANWSINFIAISAVLLFGGLLLWLLPPRLSKNQLLSRYATEARRPLHQLQEGGWLRVLSAMLLLGLIAWRYYTIAVEALIRPVFAWDAWASWVPRTLQFFETGTLEAGLKTIKGSHGLFTNLVHYWAMLGAGTPQATFTALPWLGASLSITLGVYGWLRPAGAPLLPALLGCYLLISLPFFDIHSMLAGYADLWLTLAMLLGLSSCAAFAERPTVAGALLVVFYAGLSASIKQAGFGCALILLACLVHSCLCRSKAWAASVIPTIAAAASALCLLLPQSGLQVSLPLFGEHLLLMDSEQLGITGFMLVKIDAYDSIGHYLFESLFLFPSWHLLFPIAIGAYLWTLLRGDYRRACFHSTPLALVLGLLYSALYHGLAAPEAAAGHQGLTRSMLYFVPALICWLVIAFQYTQTREVDVRTLSRSLSKPQ